MNTGSDVPTVPLASFITEAQSAPLDLALKITPSPPADESRFIFPQVPAGEKGHKGYSKSLGATSQARARGNLRFPNNGRRPPAVL